MRICQNTENKTVLLGGRGMRAMIMLLQGCRGRLGHAYQFERKLREEEEREMARSGGAGGKRQQKQVKNT